MKVKNNKEITPLLESSKFNKLKKKEEKEEKLKQAQQRRESSDLTVNLSLAKAINEQLDPSVIKEERSKKVEELKQRVKEGNYRVSSKDVARSIVSGLDEIN